MARPSHGNDDRLARDPEAAIAAHGDRKRSLDMGTRTGQRASFGVEAPQEDTKCLTCTAHAIVGHFQLLSWLRILGELP